MADALFPLPRSRSALWWAAHLCVMDSQLTTPFRLVCFSLLLFCGHGRHLGIVMSADKTVLSPVLALCIEVVVACGVLSAKAAVGEVPQWSLLSVGHSHMRLCTIPRNGLTLHIMLAHACN